MTLDIFIFSTSFPLAKTSFFSYPTKVKINVAPESGTLIEKSPLIPVFVPRFDPLILTLTKGILSLFSFTTLPVTMFFCDQDDPITNKKATKNSCFIRLVWTKYMNYFTMYNKCLFTKL